MSEASFHSTIVRELAKLNDTLSAKSPDTKHNTGRLISEAFVWDMIEKYAKAQSEAAWKKLEDEEIIDKTEDLTEGNHTLAESPSFSVLLKQTKPRKNFKAEALQESLKAKYRVPLHTSREMIEKAKLEGNPVKTYTIVER